MFDWEFVTATNAALCQPKRALTLAARGIEGLARNNGRMRRPVGCTLNPQDLDLVFRHAEAGPPGVTMRKLG